MPILNLFSKQQKLLRGEMPDVYQYNVIPQPLRVQIVQIISGVAGDDSYSTDSESRKLYRRIHDDLAHEYGRFSLGDSDSAQDNLFNFILQSKDVEQVLDCIQVSFAWLQRMNYSYFQYTGPRQTVSEGNAELNARFQEHGVGFQLVSGRILRNDSEYVHAEAVKPALALLAEKPYAGANKEFLSAHEHYRHGRYEEAIADALKSVESVLKAICTKRVWPYAQTDSAKTLLDTAFAKGLVPTYLQSEFTALRSTLESGVPTVRNKQAGHGQGVLLRQVPEHLAAYILHLAASGILFLVRSEQALP